MQGLQLCDGKAPEAALRPALHDGRSLFRAQGAGIYRKNLCKVEKKADIPAGMYACGAIQYRCPECGKRITLLDPFLPVRGEEKHEGNILFEKGELDEFLWW